jgi:putative transposase
MQIQNQNKPYHSNNNSVYSCQYHVIFCPKYRRKVLLDKISKRLEELILDKQEDYSYAILDIDVMPDYVHLLIDVSPKIGIWATVNKIKGYTSNILRKEFPELKSKLPTLWTHSKFISTVGSVTLETVKKYIEEQKNK